MNEKTHKLMVEIKGLENSYEKGNIKALNGVILEIEEGEFISILGPPGSRKSTLLRMIGSLDVVDSGTISVADYDSPTDYGSSRKKKLSGFLSKKNRIKFKH